MLTNNIFFFKKTEPIFPFRADKRKFTNSENKSIVYWVTKLDDHKRWVILLHYYGGSSQNMIERANIYIKNGFSILFVDARSHGSSSVSTSSTAYSYALDVMEIIEYEGIKVFNLHGISLGGFASLIISKIARDSMMDISIKGIVVEAISKDLKNILWYALDYSPFPRPLFSWIAKAIYFYWKQFDFIVFGPENILKETFHIPVFLIQGEEDNLYYSEIHFKALETIIFSQWHHKKSKTWLVKGSSHLGMDKHPQYANRLTNFLIQ